ncbi:MAG TPA: hypothetical protein VGC18_12085 [Lacisediminihabitans sp.]|uniref:hypothetical protein n=1 Tax=Lacisediminihabitans sp. TaxID=2787631 RepID=UPI002EDAC913
MSDETPRARPETGAVEPAPDEIEPERVAIEETVIDERADEAVPLDEPTDDIKAKYVLVEEVPAVVSSTEPVAATDDPAAVELEPRVEAAPPVQTIYVSAPLPPAKKGNRRFGVLMAVLSAVVFAILFALVVAVIHAGSTGTISFSFIDAPTFYVPVLYFLAGFILLALLANRAGWWAYVLGSLLVGIFVYFGTVGTLLLVNGIIAETPDQASALFSTALADPYVIAAALLSREISLWVGAAISARGRRVREKNAEAQALYERESAERRAEFDRGTVREGLV